MTSRVLYDRVGRDRRYWQRFVLDEFDGGRPLFTIYVLFRYVARARLSLSLRVMCVYICVCARILGAVRGTT